MFFLSSAGFSKFTRKVFCNVFNRNTTKVSNNMDPDQDRLFDALIHVCFLESFFFLKRFLVHLSLILIYSNICIILPAKSDSDVMLCLQSYHGFMIDRSLVY